MSFPLNFAQRHNYNSRETGITLNAILRSGNQEFQCKAKVDTGAEYCLFSREVGEVLGIDIEQGLERELGTCAARSLPLAMKSRWVRWDFSLIQRFILRKTQGCAAICWADTDGSSCCALPLLTTTQRFI